MELIVTHSNTDFDGLAAQLAAQKLYPRALAMLQRRLRDNVAEFEALYHDQLPFVAEDDLPDEPVSRLIVVDTPIPPGLNGLDTAFIPTIIIDHHPRQREPRPNEQVHHAAIGATTSLLIGQLIDAGIELTPTEATLMLLGIYDDTGSLSFSSTTQADLAAAAWLLGQGARIEALGEFLRRPLNTAQQDVLGKLEATMRIEPIGGWPTLLASAELEGETPQLAILAEKLRDLYTPAITGLAISSGDNGTQLILRANPDAIDIGATARAFGGGGHAAAAAAFVRGSSAHELLPDLEHAIRRDIQPVQTASHVMTRWVQSAPIQASVAEAQALLERTGHSALPVIDEDGTLQGLITRREIAQASRHGRSDAPITRYMIDEPPVVGPNTLLPDLRHKLAEPAGAQAGRLLVTDDRGKLLGLVARSDLLRALDGPPEQPRNNLAERLEQQLAPTQRQVLARAAALADAQESSLYVVGGTVRDLLLGRAHSDLDLLIEGDAIALAEALADETSGHVTSHRQFGTATLHTAEGQHLDFITARTEFYHAPAALPDVEASSLRNDLLRRDFTINTLALCLNPSRHGQLYDFYGGRHDIEQRLIRVLHNLSFLDDPTRMLRAARLSARLEFQIEPRTRALIDDALESGVLRRTSPQRVLHELRLSLNEAAPEQVLSLLAELGVLAAIHPALGWTPKQAAQLKTALRAEFADVATEQIGLALLLYPLDSAARAETQAALLPPNDLARVFSDLDRLAERRSALRAAELPNSALDRLLHGLGAAVLRAAQVAEPGLLAERIARYLAELRPASIVLNGDDIKRLGAAPGPQIGQILAGLRAARLDGLLHSREDELAWATHAMTTPPS